MRGLTRKLDIDEQSRVAMECKSNPKKFWNFINSKTKTRNYIGDITYTDDDNTDVTASNDQDKANAFCRYFSSVFNKELGDDYVSVPTDNLCSCHDEITVDISDIVKRLSKLDINKSP